MVLADFVGLEFQRMVSWLNVEFSPGFDEKTELVASFVFFTRFRYENRNWACRPELAIGWKFESGKSCNTTRRSPLEKLDHWHVEISGEFY